MTKFQKLLWWGTAPCLGCVLLLTHSLRAAAAPQPDPAATEVEAAPVPADPRDVSILHVDMIQLSLERMAELADEIVEGVVVGQRPVFPAQGIAYTEVELLVRSVVKGSPPAQVRVHVAGARDGERLVRVMGSPELHAGETVFLFLLDRPEVVGPEPSRVILGLGQGTYRIPPAAPGAARVVGVHARGEASFEEFGERVRQLLEGEGR